MSQRLSLQALAELMGWHDDQATKEFRWLRLMSRIKYDGYQDYLAGVRFLESLITWLRQFRDTDRPLAYKLLRERLVFISTAEMRRLVERLYPRYVEPQLMRDAAELVGIEWFRVWSHPPAVEAFEKLRRQTLFMGMSDGARMDSFRRANIGIISNEQAVLAPLVDDEKWRDLGSELRKDKLIDNPAAQFTQLCLIDDMSASGTTLIRVEEGTGKWGGKLPKLRDAIWKARASLRDDFPLALNFKVLVYHYVATQQALESARQLDARARSECGDGNWFPSTQFAADLILNDEATVNGSECSAYSRLAENYYDPVLEDRHSAVSGIKSMSLGYKKCALTVVLEHNTPNNSIALLWADTKGQNGAHSMRPLFRRRTRHS